MLESNQINKIASDRAYRPYIGLNGISVASVSEGVNGTLQFNSLPTPNTRNFDFRAEIKNFGPVPGGNFTGNWRAFLNGKESNSTSAPASPYTLFPGAYAYLSGDRGAANYHAIINGSKLLIIQITVEYDGPSGHYKECVKSQFSPDLNGFLSLGACTL